ncbi:MAG: 2-C-methyl-D-erythritol 4-phosphate cytidylyltransferase [Phycisphaerae bacterium]|nr:2-C-methyl-D-erythritol 4-phosphate cytidylyltransferase [Phycisphaerae bacterium]
MNGAIARSDLVAKYAVIVVAAGKGQRFGGNEKKAFVKIDDRPLLLRAAELFINRAEVCQVLLAVDPEDVDEVKTKYGANLGFMGIQLVGGGAERYLTVQAALDQIRDDAEYVVIHDAVRVCTTEEMIQRVFAEAAKSGAAILAAPLTGTIKRATSQQVIEETISREGLWEAQTPQVFRKELIQRAYGQLTDGAAITDDAAVVEAIGEAVTVVPSDFSNIKITFPGDLLLAKAILKSRPKPRTAGLGAFEEAQW